MLTPPVTEGALLLGEDTQGELAAVALLYDQGRDGLTLYVKLAAIAVARGHQGEGLGAEALEMALREAEDRAYGSGCVEVQVVGLIHRRNTASRALCSRVGFGFIGEAAEPGYDEWGLILDLPADLPDN